MLEPGLFFQWQYAVLAPPALKSIQYSGKGVLGHAAGSIGADCWEIYCCWECSIAWGGVYCCSTVVGGIPLLLVAE